MALDVSPDARIEEKASHSTDFHSETDHFHAEASLILERVAASAHSALPLPNLLVILAHPDDEVLALGGRLERLRQSFLLCCTDGAPASGDDARDHGFSDLETYRQARRSELAAALKLAGLPDSCAETLLIKSTSGESGAVADQAAVFHLTALTMAIMREIGHRRPEAVLTHPYEGGHPDHDSCAFAVHAAVRLVPPIIRPLVLEAPFYHAGKNGMRTGAFPGDSSSGTEAARSCISCVLSAAERDSKRDRLACFVSQRRTLAQFALNREQFRIAPTYDFSRPPHGGELLYERFPWGVSGKQFRERAISALSSLKLSATNEEARST